MKMIFLCLILGIGLLPVKVNSAAGCNCTECTTDCDSGTDQFCFPVFFDGNSQAECSALQSSCPSSGNFGNGTIGSMTTIRDCVYTF